MSQTVTIYALADHDSGNRHYVGKTIQDPPENRLKHHLRKPENEALGAWFEELSAKGGEPAFHVLEQLSEEEDWRAAEVYWIRKGLAEGWPIRDTGSGGEDYPLDAILNAAPDEPVSREIYGDKAVFIPLTQLNVHVCRGRSPDTGVFMDLLHDALDLLRAFKSDTDRYRLREEHIREKLLDQGIIRPGKPWRAEISSQRNAIGGERMAVPRPLRIHGMSVPGNWTGSEGYHARITMWRKTSDLLDDLATALLDGRRAGYGATLGAALALFGSICDEIATDEADDALA